ncbi:MAG: polysaccharide pyruvyl transferase CsaB [Desulfotomaculales bacterium]
MPKIVISGYYGFANAGDEAMLWAMVSALRDRVSGAEIVVLSARPEQTRAEFDVQAVGRNSLPQICGALRGADLLISGGGGLLQDVTSRWSIFYYLGIILLAKMFGCRVYLYGQGIGPLRTSLGRGALRMVANRADLISVRDVESRDELVRLKVWRPAIHVTADPALGLDTRGTDRERGRRLLRAAGATGSDLVGISVRSWKGLRRIQTVVARLGDYLAAEGWQVVLVPMQYSEDLPVCREVAALMQHPPVVLEERYPFWDLLSMTANFGLAVGMRLHFLIFAALAHVPLVGIAYDPKITRFIQQLDLPSPLPAEDLRFEELKFQVDFVHRYREGVSFLLADRVAVLRQQALRSADLAAELLRQRPQAGKRSGTVEVE